MDETSRMRSVRPLGLAVALLATVGSGMAAAQTVVVRGAPPGSTVEFVLNTTTVATGTADSAGDITLAARQTAATSKSEMDAHLYVDTCGNVRRVLIVDRGIPAPPPEVGCDRAQIAGLFLVRRVSTVVVNVAGPNPTVLLRQGRFDPRTASATRTWAPSPTGLVLFGGGGLGKFADVQLRACGDVTACSGGGFRGAYTAGVTYWIVPFLAAEAGYLKLADAKVTGNQSNFRFDSFLEADIATITGKAGIPIGPVRLYGHGGANYHRATFGTTQTVEPTTITVDGVQQTIPGGTQSYQLRTAGWGWLFGGGLETWFNSHFAMYAEAGRLVVKGNVRDEGEGNLDDRITYIVLGARIRIGG